MSKNFLQSDVEVLTNIARDENTIVANIKAKNFKKMYSLFENPYTNPIGSIVREITTNAIDSHIEVKQKKDVQVRLLSVPGNDTDITAEFQVEDFGHGIDWERAQIIASYLESTKEQDIEQQGFYGLGSKSPLSYTKTFTIIGRKDGIEYVFMMIRGEEEPVLQLIDKYETIEPNGSIWKIPVRERDISKFIDEIEYQLKYCSNVQITSPYLNESRYNEINNYKIVDFNYFKLRLQFEEEVDGKSVYKVSSNNLDIAIDKIAYPMPRMYETKLDLPVGVKFNIGELSVPLTRENIKLNEKANILIPERINLVKLELTDLIAKWSSKLDRDDRINFNVFNGEALLEIASNIYIKYRKKGTSKTPVLSEFKRYIKYHANETLILDKQNLDEETYHYVFKLNYQKYILNKTYNARYPNFLTLNNYTYKIFKSFMLDPNDTSDYVSNIIKQRRADINKELEEQYKALQKINQSKDEAEEVELPIEIENETRCRVYNTNYGINFHSIVLNKPFEKSKDLRKQLIFLSVDDSDKKYFLFELYRAQLIGGFIIVANGYFKEFEAQGYCTLDFIKSPEFNELVSKKIYRLFLKDYNNKLEINIPNIKFTHIDKHKLYYMHELNRAQKFRMQNKLRYKYNFNLISYVSHSIDSNTHVSVTSYINSLKRLLS